jgi:hypothetical protein
MGVALPLFRETVKRCANYLVALIFDCASAKLSLITLGGLCIQLLN